MSLKWPLFHRYLDPHPIKLITNGQIEFKNLSKARISVDFLFSELRKEKIEDIQKVSLALWEPGGTLSIFVETAFQPVTPTDLNLVSQPFNLIRPIIVDGKINLQLLKEIGKDTLWLNQKLEIFHMETHDVVLATIDYNEKVHVYSNPKITNGFP